MNERPAGEAARESQAKAQPAQSIALCGGSVVVSLDPPEVIEADVVISGDRISAVGVAPAGCVRRDCSGTIVMPGNVCAHHHLYSALARGMPYRLEPPRSFTEILQRVWWRLDRALDDASVRASALHGGLDALLAGTTTIVDHHASPNAIDGSLDVVAGALGELGVRSVLCYEVTDRDGLERAQAGVEENLRFLSKDPAPLARGMMGAHASFTLSDETLAACSDGARASGVGVHIHVAEDGADQRDSLARSGRRVVDRLQTSGVLDEEALLAHCIHVAPAEIDAVLAAGATVACNPRSNMNNGVGHSPFNLVPGERVALGTDGIDGNMFAESQAGFFRSREADLGAPFDWPLKRLAAGASFAGRAFGEPLLGTLRPGAPADVTVVDVAPPTPLYGGNLAGHLLFGLAGARVREVYVAGERIVSDFRSTRVDQAALADQCRGEARRLWERMEDIPPHDFTPEEGRR